MEMPTYLGQLTEAMTWLGEKPDTIFLGQSVLYPGNTVFKTLAGVPDSKKIELPVAEDMQLGQAIGLALSGYAPICIFPRMDFLLLAVNQLVNHLDRLSWSPKVIIRTAVGATKPLHPGEQHCGDYTEGLDAMLRNTKVVKLIHPEDIQPSYMGSYAGGTSKVFVEMADLYGL